MKALTVLMISEDYLPCIGGISHHVTMLASALARRGNSVYVFARDPVEKGQFRNYDNNVSHVLIRTRTPENRILQKARHLHFTYKGLPKIRQLLDNNEFDIIHWHGLWSDNLFAYYSSKRSKAKLVFTNHSSMFLEIYRGRISRLLLNAWLCKPDICIATSSELAEKYAALCKGVKTVFIPNGIDLRMFSTSKNKVEQKRALGVDEESVVVLCPRRLCRKNGVQYLIQAIPHIPDELKAVFIVAGDGPLMERLKYQSVRLGISKKIHFLGAVPYNIMPKLYTAADIVVLPSLMEAVSLAALEAMASGLPVIASDVGGLRDLLCGTDAGILVPSADPLALSKEICKLISNSEERLRKGEKAKQIAAKYSWDNIATMTESVYREIL